MKSLTFIYITCREKPELEWFLKSVENEMTGRDCAGKRVECIVVNSFKVPTVDPWGNRLYTKIVAAKPTVWQGLHRLTKQDWWAASNARNTGLCLCQTEWVCFVDDRSVLMPGFMTAIESAMDDNYAVCGTYEKRRGMRVENGVIKHGGIVTGIDSRLEYAQKHWEPAGLKPPFKAPGEWTYGCAIALPLEWALQINGWTELCDSLGGEDYVFGTHLQNSGYPIMFDPRMKLIEDRTPEHCGPVAIRRDFGASPNDYSHQVLNSLKNLKSAPFGFDLRAERAKVLATGTWSEPWGPRVHSWDGTPLEKL